MRTQSDLYSAISLWDFKQQTQLAIPRPFTCENNVFCRYRELNLETMSPLLLNVYKFIVVQFDLLENNLKR